jgi:hypothetical protein
MVSEGSDVNKGRSLILRIQYADIEQLVLSGKLFNGEERSSSPERSPSPDHIPHKDWPDDAIENHESDQEDDLSDSERAKLHPSSMQPARGPREPIGMGPGRTGVKGVIRDRNEAVQRNRERRAKEIEALNRKMEKASLGGKTFLEEEREREWEKARLEGLSVPPGVEKGSRKGKFGHLREVGAEGFVKAVENERGIWVVMHIYDPVRSLFVGAHCYTDQVDITFHTPVAGQVRRY